MEFGAWSIQGSCMGRVCYAASHGNILSSLYILGFGVSAKVVNLDKYFRKHPHAANRLCVYGIGCNAVGVTDENN